MNRIYLSGAITNNPNYKSQFAIAEKMLTIKGYEVVNPARVDIPCLSWREFMEIDLGLLDLCDSIYMLDGWKNSKGANIEYGYAKAKDKKIYEGDERQKL